MSAKIIAIANQKGGVGKTTTTYNLAASLAMAGERVLMIDLDPQYSLTVNCGFKPNASIFNGKSVQNVFDPKTDIEECCFTVDSVGDLSEMLYLIPSSQELAVWERDLYLKQNKAIPNFKENIKKLTYFDYIFIDCPPNLGALLLTALYSSDGIIIPVQTTFVSYEGLGLLMSTIKATKEVSPNKLTLSNPGLKILGVIGTLYRGMVAEHNEVLKRLVENYNVLGVIKEAAAVSKGFEKGLPVVLNLKQSDAAKEYNRIADNLLLLE